MNQAFKPDGYNSLSPYLIVDDAQKLMDLLKEVFGAKELRGATITKTERSCMPRFRLMTR
ncbi:hypothetical protein [Sinobaca sp. H24]|uniref:hypothetical protein n=1 Tax=Sinobaca sp. H24 TaxID=2923376 RepID=UPI00207B0518|nr:hypothetical protein [Sinobaca sp. H24]